MIGFVQIVVIMFMHLGQIAENVVALNIKWDLVYKEWGIWAFREWDLISECAVELVHLITLKE